MLRHDPGRGLKVVGRPGERWWGLGSCGICGETAEEGTSPLVPQAVRWWDPDDGWRFGVLCLRCGQEARTRGPRRDDFAVATRRPQAEPARLDLAAVDDPDAALSDLLP